MQQAETKEEPKDPSFENERLFEAEKDARLRHKFITLRIPLGVYEYLLAMSIHKGIGVSQVMREAISIAYGVDFPLGKRRRWLRTNAELKKHLADWVAGKKQRLRL